MSNIAPKLISLNHRLKVVVFCFFLSALVLIFRAIEIQIRDSEFLIKKGLQQYNKLESIPTIRGKIFDRNGELLAISVESESIYVRPKKFLGEQSRWGQLEVLIGQEKGYIQRRIYPRKEAKFVYIQPRLIPPEVAAQVRALRFSGLGFERQFSRFYPHKEETAHLLGYTGDDQEGQEGIELLYDKHLAGVPGRQRVFHDAKKKTIREPELLNEPKLGQDLNLTIDQRVQYAAFKHLKNAVDRHHADAGSLVIVEVSTGEVIAMVNQPSFNPNRRSSMVPHRVRNRTVTDSFEPGSTIKPFTAAAVISDGLYEPDSRVDTSPGTFQLGDYEVGDAKNYGVLSLRQILAKSSNVGAIKISLDLSVESMWNTLNDVGFGNPSGLMFPGESFGRLKDFELWHPTERATLSYGYGMSVTTSQLAKAYSAIANGGFSTSLKIVKSTISDRQDHRVLQEDVTIAIRNMLETAVESGTGKLAQVPGYSVAGKTGTVRKSVGGKYSNNQHLAIFAGIFPAKEPRLVAVVVIDNPNNEVEGGGLVAAPVFSAVMQEAARFLNIQPDLESSGGLRPGQVASLSRAHILPVENR